MTTSAELGRGLVGLGESAAVMADTDCRWPLIPGVGEVMTSGGGYERVMFDGDDEDFLCTPETGRRCCHDNKGGVFGEPEGDENPDGLKPDMVFRNV